MKKRNVFALITLTLLAAGAPAEAQITLTRVTNGDIVNDRAGCSWAAWGDFFNSGLMDAFVCNYGDRTNLFYRNNGDQTFTKVTQGAPVADADFHIGAAEGDYDNDGNLDLVVTAGADAPSARQIKLYRNEGHGIFTPVSGGSITNQLGWFVSCAWADYDRDGFLDLCVNESSHGSNLLFRNNGDGTFDRVTTGPVVTDQSLGAGVVWGDYDNDGYDDLLVPTGADNGVNFLYHNNKNGTFTRVLTNAIATDRWSGGTDAAAWGDYDNDGLLDLFITCQAGTPNRLYHNEGGGRFTSISSGSTALRPAGTDSKGCAWGDYDNDGYLDLFVTSYNGPNMLFHNNGDGTFSQILNDDPVTDDNTHVYCNACAWVDYDNDGFLDLFVTRATNGLAATTSNYLYHNSGNTNAWLKVKLIGTVSNRSAIGAKVRIRATIGGKTFWQLREISNGGGRSVQPLEAHFGLGNATNVETLRVEWPSGTIQEFPNVKPRHSLTITEPAHLTATSQNGIPQLSLKGGRSMQYDIQSSLDLSAWSVITTVTITNVEGVSRFMDTNAPADHRRFYRAVSR